MRRGHTRKKVRDVIQFLPFFHNSKLDSPGALCYSLQGCLMIQYIDRDENKIVEFCFYLFKSVWWEASSDLFKTKTRATSGSRSGPVPDKWFCSRGSNICILSQRHRYWKVWSLEKKKKGWSWFHTIAVYSAIVSEICNQWWPFAWSKLFWYSWGSSIW